MSGVGDFSYAFSSYRNRAGGSRVNGGNPKAATFVGTAMSKWITTSVTTLEYTFRGAGGMNADLSGWNVAKVTSLEHTFKSSKFKGTGLSSWITTSVTTLKNTFWEAVEMDADLSGWNVAKVKTLESTFGRASVFEGTGLRSWDIASVTKMSKTFFLATSLKSCNKRLIADAWKSSSVFVATTYLTDWAADTCTVQEPSPRTCVDGTYMHQTKCVATCPSGYYGDRGSSAAQPPQFTCKPCMAGCTKCHDFANCVDCSTTCSLSGATTSASAAAGVATAAGDGKQQCVQKCKFTLPPPPQKLGPGGKSGGPGSGTPVWPTVDVKFNITIPQKGNITSGNTTYTSQDACGVNNTHNTKTLVSPPGPDGSSEQLWCSWWSPDRHEWVREGCSAENIYQSVDGGGGSSNETNQTMTTTVTCNCAIVIPPDKDLSFAGGGSDYP